MEHALYQRFFEIEDTHWWSTWVRDLVRDWLPAGPANRRILDLGCGTGILSREFAGAGRITSMDYAAEAFDFCRRRGLTRLVRGDGHALPFPAETFDLILAIDTLEHFQDDERAIREIRRVLAPGGALVINVPALRILWSDHDVANHHYRRYGRRQLRELLVRGGFAIFKLTFTNCVLFAPALLARSIQRLGAAEQTLTPDSLEFHPAVSRLSSPLLAAERRLVRHVNLPLGTSLFAVAVPVPGGAAP